MHINATDAGADILSNSWGSSSGSSVILDAIEYAIANGALGFSFSWQRQHGPSLSCTIPEVISVAASNTVTQKHPLVTTATGWTLPLPAS